MTPAETPGETRGKRTFIREHRRFSQADFDLFARLSRDDNPIHVDPEFSANARFGKTVAHGMMLYSVIWGRIKSHFPQAVMLEQQLMFPAPTYAEEDLELEIAVSPSEQENQLVMEGLLRRCRDREVTCKSLTRIELEASDPC